MDGELLWYWRRWRYVLGRPWRAWRWRAAQGEAVAFVAYVTAIFALWGVPACVVLLGMNG